MTRPHRVEAGGLVGAVEPRAEGALLRHVLCDLPAALGVGATVKQNLYRRAVRVEVPSLGAVLVKVHEPRGLRDRVRGALRRSRAATEWDAARYLRGAGLPTPQPIFCGERRRGVVLERAASVARFLPRRETLAPTLRSQPARVARACLRRVARWVRALHDRGVSHGDLHSGNVLVGPGPGDRATLHVVDLHRVRVGREVEPSRRTRELARLLHSLREAVGPGGRLAALLAYEGERPRRRRLRARRARIEREIARLERRRLASRAARCFVESSAFTRDVGEGKGARRRDLSLEALAHALADHDRALATRSAAVLKDGRRSRVTHHGTVLVKESLAPLRHRSGYRNAHALAVRGIGTAAPLACLERLGRRFALYEDLSRFPRLDHRILALRKEGALTRSAKRTGIEATADFAARVHALGVHHGDWKACNWLVEDGRGGPAFRLVDTDRVRFLRRVSRRRRLRNLAQLAASVPRCVTRTDRLRWLRRYVRGTALAGREAERAAARDVLALVARKTAVVDEPIE